MEQREPEELAGMRGMAAAGEAVAGEAPAAPSAAKAGAGLASSPVPAAGAPVLSGSGEPAAKARPADPFVRAENEDDDGYDPYSDRPAPREPMFERDPWG